MRQIYKGFLARNHISEKKALAQKKTMFLISNIIFFTYLCQIMENPTTNTHKYQSPIVILCDIAILNACCATIAYYYTEGLDWISLFLAINAILIIAIRHICMNLLGIGWLESFLNRAIKRLADIVFSAIFLLSIFPIAYVISAILIRAKKGFADGSIISIQEMQFKEKRFSSIVFSESDTIFDNPFLSHLPLAFNVLFGTISIWDLTSVREVQVQQVSEEETFIEEAYIAETSTTEDNGITIETITSETENKSQIQ